ncbi:hypothetical protein KCG54_10100 [Neisseria subflava]|uniref:Uncharacterized protein n=1 Tax=Neisseria subflava TaxID=28449 RepID=A0A9X9N173_NEISU|nr:hypothetical protein [Neisseria subflava]UTG69515.1 hypothetical protein KCG54_10100 [Neisseria subflava]
MYRIGFVFLFFYLYFIYFSDMKGDHQDLLAYSSEKVSVKDKLDNGIYFLYKKCNLSFNKCHELQADRHNDSYYLSGNQEPNEERMYIYVRDSLIIMYSLIYYDEEMIPTIIWSELKRDGNSPFTYTISKNTTVFGLNDDGDINNFYVSNTNGHDNSIVKIGDTPKGKEYYLNQKVSFRLVKGSDFSIDCKKYLNDMKKLNVEDKASFGGILEMACDTDSFFRNTAKYGEKRSIYFKKLE